MVATRTAALASIVIGWLTTRVLMLVNHWPASSASWWAMSSITHRKINAPVHGWLGPHVV